MPFGPRDTWWGSGYSGTNATSVWANQTTANLVWYEQPTVTPLPSVVAPAAELGPLEWLEKQVDDVCQLAAA